MKMLACLLLVCPALFAQGELRFCLRTEPRTLHPLLAAEDASVTIRDLTSGYLICINRATQKAEPALAASWKQSADGKSIAFRLRPGIAFSDGTPFSSADVAYTIQAATDPGLHSPMIDALTPGGGKVTVNVTAPDSLAILFPASVANPEKIFDQLAIISSKSPLKEKAALGPFFVDARQPGSEILLKRNPHYWKKDEAGRKLPYLDAVRLAIQSNQEIEYTRFRRGEIQLINRMSPEFFERLKKEAPEAARDSGPAMDVEFLWFNQTPSSPLPAYKKGWFASRNFRLAISQAINRDDICRVVYKGFGQPALGPFSNANRFWFNAKLKPQTFDRAAAQRLLEADGFRLKDGALRDKSGNAVEFSVVTNAGNKLRERTAALIQEDLKALGIQLNIVTLDFPSLIERITRSFQYEACLLGLTNVDLDPDEQMNVWLSSSPDHAWNPSQKAPATPWEAEIDRLMRAQAASLDRNKRKELFDRVQEIVRAEIPYIYLVNRNSLSAISPALKGVNPGVLPPETYWNIDRISLP
jgi:peptide/nickel transport system substrate-binding protein